MCSFARSVDVKSSQHADGERRWQAMKVNIYEISVTGFDLPTVPVSDSIRIIA
jgi:hypothetical protein